MLYLNEIKKTSGRIVLLLLLCVLVLNGVLIVSGENDRGYLFDAKDYRKLYAIDAMNGSAEEQRDFLMEYVDCDITRLYYLGYYVRSDIAKVEGYRDYLDKIAITARNYGKMSIFGNNDEFSGQNIKKTAEIYASLPEIKTEPGPTRGIVMASQYSGSFVLSLLFIVYIVFSLVIKEKEIGSLNLTMATKLGHVDHGLSKLLVCLLASVIITLVLEAENWIIASFTYSLGDMGRSIQSIPEYQPCIFNVSIRGFIVMSVCLKAVCVYLFATILFFFSCSSRNLPGLVLKLTAVFGSEGVLYYAVLGNSIWSLLKYINIFCGLNAHELLGNYMNLNFFGKPVWYMPVFTIFVILVSIVFSICGILAYENMQPVPEGSRIYLSKLPARTSSVLVNELFRYFICEHMFLILIAFAIMELLTFSPVNETFGTQEDVYYKQYMLKLQGMYSADKESEIDEEERLFSEMTEKANAAASSTDDLQIKSLILQKYNDESAHFSVLYKVRDQAEYLKEKNGAFLYDRGYRILSGEGSGQEMNMLLAAFAGLMMVICSCVMYGPDYQAGTEKIIRATYRGRLYLFFRRELIGTVMLLLIFATIYLPYTMSVLTAYGVQGMDFPACSVRSLEWCPHWITLRGYLIGLNIIRFMILWAGMNLIWYISTKVRSMGYTFCIGGGLVAAEILLIR